MTTRRHHHRPSSEARLACRTFFNHLACRGRVEATTGRSPSHQGAPRVILPRTRQRGSDLREGRTYNVTRGTFVISRGRHGNSIAQTLLTNPPRTFPRHPRRQSIR